MKTILISSVIILSSACGQNSNFSAAPKKADSKPATPVEEPAVVSEPETTIAPEVPVEVPVVDPTVAFAKLNGSRWDLPCAVGAGCATPSSISTTVEMEGEAAKEYIVKVRIRGVVEPMMYKDGAASPVDDHFYVGGTPNNPHYNIYQLTVENPAQDYYLNQSASVSATTFVIDYTVDLTIGGKSKVTLFADPQNGSSISNTAALTVPGITTPSELLTGQFVQMDVISVTVK